MATLSNIRNSQISPFGPVGSLAFFGVSSAPTGFLKANGAAVSRTAYAALFGVIGTTFGVGDGSTTFNLPDLRGEFPRGWDDSRGIDSGRSLGTSQTDDLKSHNHVTDHLKNAGPFGVGAGGANILIAVAVGNTNSTGGTETRPRNVALLACIKF